MEYDAWKISFADSGKSALDGVILAATADEAVARAVRQAGLDPQYRYSARKLDV